MDYPRLAQLYEGYTRFSSVKPKPPPPPPILIAVLGITGAGKSTFINRATGRDDLAVSAGNYSCTRDIALSRLDIDGKTVILVDTPGFDDTTRSDADILQLIAEWLKATYDANTLLTGVIMLHPIQTLRFYNSEKNRTRVFEKILGNEAFKHVVLCTTMWDKLRPEDIVGHEMLVKERISNKELWGEMYDQGAMICSHDNTCNSTINIIRKLLSMSPFVTEMQDELEKNNGLLSMTSAGQQLYSQYSDFEIRMEKEFDKIRNEQEEMKRNRDALNKELAELRQSIQAAKDQKATLKEKVTGLGKGAWLSALTAVGTMTMTAYTTFCPQM